MIRLSGPFSTGTTTGGAGTSTATATTSTKMSGRLLAVYVQYNDSPPAGSTDLTVATSGDSHPAVTFLTLTNAATNGWFYPRVTPHGTTGAALSALTVLEPIPFDDKIKITIAQANDGDSATVYLLIEE